MKKNIKLTSLAQNVMKEKEMSHINGGKGCGCSCYYEGDGGSSTDDNGVANSKSGLNSPKGKLITYVTP
jgi:natural product precursor